MQKQNLINYIAKIINTNNKNQLNTTEAGKTLVRCLGCRTKRNLKVVLKENKDIEENLNELFATALHLVEDEGQIPVPELTFCRTRG